MLHFFNPVFLLIEVVVVVVLVVCELFAAVAARHTKLLEVTFLLAIMARGIPSGTLRISIASVRSRSTAVTGSILILIFLGVASVLILVSLSTKTLGLPLPDSLNHLV